MFKELFNKQGVSHLVKKKISNYYNSFKQNNSLSIVQITIIGNRKKRHPKTLQVLKKTPQTY